MKKTLLVLVTTAALTFGQGSRPPVDKISLMRDVDLTGLASGQILGWNGTKWHGVIVFPVGSGVVKVSSGAFSLATTTDLPEGSNLYYTDTRVRANRLDQMAAPTGPVSLGNQKVTNLATPTTGTDASTKAYVDSQAAATDVNITLSDITTNNASTSKHGFMSKLSGNASEYANGIGGFSVPAGGGGGGGDFSSNTTTSVDGEFVLFAGTGGKTGKRATGSGLVTSTNGVMGTVAAPFGTVVGTTDTQTFLNKTISTPAGLNVLSFHDYIQLPYPMQGDGTNATRITTEGPTYGHFTFPDNVAKANNYVLYRILIPQNLESPNANSMSMKFVYRLSGADTGSHAFYISMADVPASSSADNPTFTHEVILNIAGDSTGASGDTGSISNVSLTGWSDDLVPGDILVIKLARGSDGAGGAPDASTFAVTDLNLTIEYVATSNVTK